MESSAHIKYITLIIVATLQFSGVLGKNLKVYNALIKDVSTPHLASSELNLAN